MTLWTSASAVSSAFAAGTLRIAPMRKPSSVTAKPTDMNSYQTEHFSTDSLMNKTTEKIPTWSLGYIINGDMTGLTDEEIRMIDEWQSKWNVQIVSPLTDEEGNAQPYFSRYPLFGLPSEVEDCDILDTNDNI